MKIFNSNLNQHFKRTKIDSKLYFKLLSLILFQVIHGCAITRYVTEVTIQYTPTTFI